MAVWLCGCVAVYVVVCVCECDTSVGTNATVATLLPPHTHTPTAAASRSKAWKRRRLLGVTGSTSEPGDAMGTLKEQVRHTSCVATTSQHQHAFVTPRRCLPTLQEALPDYRTQFGVDVLTRLAGCPAVHPEGKAAQESEDRRACAVLDAVADVSALCFTVLNADATMVCARMSRDGSMVRCPIDAALCVCGCVPVAVVAVVWLWLRDCVPVSVPVAVAVAVAVAVLFTTLHTLACGRGQPNSVLPASTTRRSKYGASMGSPSARSSASATQPGAAPPPVAPATPWPCWLATRDQCSRSRSRRTTCTC